MKGTAVGYIGAASYGKVGGAVARWRMVCCLCACKMKGMKGTAVGCTGAASYGKVGTRNLCTYAI
jgi:hypothetical protein